MHLPSSELLQVIQRSRKHSSGFSGKPSKVVSKGNGILRRKMNQQHVSMYNEVTACDKYPSKKTVRHSGKGAEMSPYKELFSVLFKFTGIDVTIMLCGGVCVKPHQGYLNWEEIEGLHFKEMQGRLQWDPPSIEGSKKGCTKPKRLGSENGKVPWGELLCPLTWRQAKRDSRRPHRNVLCSLQFGEHSTRVLRACLRNKQGRWLHQLPGSSMWLRGPPGERWMPLKMLEGLRKVIWRWTPCSCPWQQKGSCGGGVSKEPMEWKCPSNKTW